MKFSDFQTLVLQNLDQYSVAGERVPNSYNNQADYTKRIAALANIALRLIATQSAPMLASFDPNADGFQGKTDIGNGYTKIKLPADFWKMSGQGLPCFASEDFYARNMHYQHISEDEIVVRTRELPGLLITYYRYPRKLQGQPGEVLDASETVADCASFYVAAELARQDSPYVYQSLYNEFESMMARLKKPMITEMSRTEDVYGF